MDGVVFDPGLNLNFHILVFFRLYVEVSAQRLKRFLVLGTDDGDLSFSYIYFPVPLRGMEPGQVNALADPFLIFAQGNLGDDLLHFLRRGEIKISARRQQKQYQNKQKFLHTLNYSKTLALATSGLNAVDFTRPPCSPKRNFFRFLTVIY